MSIFKYLKPAKIEETPNKPKPMDYTEEQIAEARNKFNSNYYTDPFYRANSVNPLPESDFPFLIEYYKVVGVTFDNEDGRNRQAIIKDIIKNFEDPEKYDGWTAAESRRDGDPDMIVYEYAGNPFPLHLEQYDYKGSPAIHVVSDFGIVGNIAKGDVKNIISILEQYGEDALEITGEIIGGRYMKTDYKNYDDPDDFSLEVIKDKFDDYGIELKIVSK